MDFNQKFFIKNAMNKVRLLQSFLQIAKYLEGILIFNGLPKVNGSKVKEKVFYFQLDKMVN
jgi:hypothetical protein